MLQHYKSLFETQLKSLLKAQFKSLSKRIKRCYNCKISCQANTLNIILRFYLSCHDKRIVKLFVKKFRYNNNIIKNNIFFQFYSIQSLF